VFIEAADARAVTLLELDDAGGVHRTSVTSDSGPARVAQRVGDSHLRIDIR